MGLKNVLIAVADIEKTKKFYKEIFGLYAIRDFGDNVMLSEGLVLQSKSTWQKVLKSDISVGNSFELFFEEYNLDEFVLALKEKEGVKFVTTEPFTNDKKRHSLKVMEESINAEFIKEKYRNNKILVEKLTSGIYDFIENDTAAGIVKEQFENDTELETELAKKNIKVLNVPEFFKQLKNKIDEYYTK